MLMAGILLLNDRRNCLLNKRQYFALIKRRDFEREQFSFQIDQHEQQANYLRKQSSNRGTVKSMKWIKIGSRIAFKIVDTNIFATA